MDNHVMVDIETLGVSPGCVILSIGAVRFDPVGPEPSTTGFYRFIDLNSSRDFGLQIETETLRWWLQPDNAKALAEFQLKAEPLAKVLSDFGSMISREDYLWCHGLLFDLPLIEAAWQRCTNDPIPWNFRLARDTRTLFDLANHKMVGYTGGMKHNAFDDALNQALNVQAAWRKIKVS